MPGNKSNVRRFNSIDVFIDASGVAAIPASYSTALPAGFERAGLLAPDGFTLARNEESNTIAAYGVDGTVEDITKFNNETWNAIFLEDNDVVRELVYPGSTTSTGGVVPIPVAKSVQTCFVLRNTATGYGERWFTHGGSIWRANGDRSTPDSDIRRTPLLCTVFAKDAAVEGNLAELYVKQASTDVPPTP